MEKLFIAICCLISLTSIVRAQDMSIEEYEGFRLAAVREDPFNNLIAQHVAEGLAIIENFFDKPFKQSVSVRLFPSRADLDKAWQEEWGMPSFQSECWMVGSGIASKLDVLSPNVWVDEACEHNPKDSLEIKRLVIHELTHVLHSDYNHSRMFDDIRNIDWFVEGLATYASGQLDEERWNRVKTHVESTGGPNQLSLFWKGDHKYGLSGSMIAYIDEAYGREVLRSLLEFNYLEDILTAIGLSEEELIGRWRTAVMVGL